VEDDVAEEHPNDVIATRSGSVFRVGWQDQDHNIGMGWRISINTGDGYFDQFGHLEPTSTLPLGTQVVAGDVIGRMAVPTNGRSTGPHVHVERRIWQDGTPIDPGTKSPFRGRSRITAVFEAQNSNLWANAHPGVDHVPE